MRFGARSHRRTQIVASCLAVLGACGLAVWANNGFPERFPHLAGVDVRKIGDWTLVAHLGHGENKVALAGDSLLFQYGPRVQQLADEGRLMANTFFVTGPRCPPVPRVTQQDKFARARICPAF